MADRWEYKIVHFSTQRWTKTGLPDDLNERFDEFGSEGWELVSTDAIASPALLFFSGSRTHLVVAYFKRRLED